MLAYDDLLVYLRLPALPPDPSALMQIVDLTNGLIEEVTGPLASVPARVRLVALEVAARAYRNPDGFTSQTVGNVTWRVAETDATRRGVYLTDGERADILGEAPSAAAWAGSMPYRR